MVVEWPIAHAAVNGTVNATGPKQLRPCLRGLVLPPRVSNRRAGPKE